MLSIKELMGRVRYVIGGYRLTVSHCIIKNIDGMAMIQKKMLLDAV